MTQVGEAVLVAMLAADDKKAKCDFKPPQTNWKANLEGDADRLGGLLGKQPKNLSVNYINLQRHLAKRDDGGREMVECNEAPFELFVANQ